jgi:hypothetical protein
MRHLLGRCGLVVEARRLHGPCDAGRKNPGIELVGGKTITAEDIMLNEEYAYLVDRGRCTLEGDRGRQIAVCAIGRHDH